MNPKFEKFKKVLSFIEKALLLLCTVLTVIGVLIIARSLINANFLNNYHKGKYPTLLEGVLPHLPFGENYVAYYNLGNVEYIDGHYDQAVTYYATALTKNPPEQDEECMIRTNLALALCHTIDFDNLDLNDQEAVTNAINVLMTARQYLTECGCASEPVGSNDGHFPDADSLKHDIDEMLKKLQSQSSSDSDDQSQGGGGQDQDDSQNQDENQDQQDQSQDQQQNNQQSQSDKDKEKEEKARQENVKEQLENQKQDLKDKSQSSSPYEYEYLEGGDAQGYGDGTLW
ncbi:MAG: hypothetical protein IJ198_05930 [Lachnospiraceae bacterium]|nr:hypothetical protein [Lachnospiraceae bacterium]